MHPAIARALRRHGIDVTTTNEAGLRTEDDETHLSFAKREGRVLVTNDKHFLRIARRDHGHPGIAFCHLTRMSLGQIIDGLLLIYEVLAPPDMVGHVEYL